MVKILKVDPTHRNQLKEFIFFPFQLYRDCSQWVPPLVQDVFRDFNPRKHHFYQHSQLQLFLAKDDDKVIGRLAVMDNRRANEYLGQKTAFFGFYDVIEDLDVSQALFQAAFEWARSRGLDRMVGPRGLNSTDNTGILVTGFEHRAAMWLPYNYPYYDGFVQAAGFQKDTDSLSGYAPGDEAMPDRLLRIAARIKERRGFEVIHFQTMKDRKYWIPRVWKVLLESFGGFEGFYPPTEEEKQSLADNLIRIADPRLIKLIQKDGEVIGFIFAYHDVTAGIQKARGRILPVGWLYLLQERRRTEWVNVNGVGVLPAYQGMGVNAILYTEIKKSIEEFGFKHIDVVQVNEANFQSRSDMENMGIRWYKSHRSYQKNL
jgi:GNAT superfamily N-acetyltransferase